MNKPSQSRVLGEPGLIPRGWGGRPWLTRVHDAVRVRSCDVDGPPPNAWVQAQETWQSKADLQPAVYYELCQGRKSSRENRAHEVIPEVEYNGVLT
ncbi:hypothetical protein IF1G_02002 [Cordyceps javanica]|uniref:Uncharacterized protein n=1 Tax=Cordyceps javanica TaxID=43265 RepID=A0A545VDI3_9HYPO|nr:hypothetical protein IF1G_02002 [Cordyceps javanica]